LGLCLLVQAFHGIVQPTRRQLREPAPAHFAGCIHKKLREAADIAAVLACFGEQQVIAADGLGIPVGKKWEGEAGLANQLAGFFRSVGADGDWFDAGAFERSQ